MVLNLVLVEELSIGTWSEEGRILFINGFEVYHIFSNSPAKRFVLNKKSPWNLLPDAVRSKHEELPSLRAEFIFIEKNPISIGGGGRLVSKLLGSSNYHTD